MKLNESKYGVRILCRKKERPSAGLVHENIPRSVGVYACLRMLKKWHLYNNTERRRMPKVRVNLTKRNLYSCSPVCIVIHKDGHYFSISGISQNEYQFPVFTHPQDDLSLILSFQSFVEFCWYSRRFTVVYKPS